MPAESAANVTVSRANRTSSISSALISCWGRLSRSPFINCGRMVSPAETLCRTVGAVSLSCGQVCSSVACRGRIAQHIAARKDCVHLANGREEFAASALGVDNHKKSSRLQPVVAAVSHKRLLRDSLVKDVVDQQHARAPRRGHTFQQASQAIGLPFLAQIEPVERLDAHGSIHREHASDNGNGCGLNASDPLGVIPARAAPQKYAAARQRLVQQKRGAQDPDKRIAARFHRSPLHGQMFASIGSGPCFQPSSRKSSGERNFTPHRRTNSIKRLSSASSGKSRST